MKIQAQYASKKIRDENGTPVETKFPFRRKQFGALYGFCQNCEQYIFFHWAVQEWLHSNSLKETCYVQVTGSPGNLCVAIPYLYEIQEMP